MNEEKIEKLEEVEGSEVGFKVEDNSNPEKIEIVEHVESKYDDIKPRTEMGDMSKEEKQEIRHKVLGEEVPIVKEESTSSSTEVKLTNPSKSGTVLKFLIIFTVLLVILGAIYMFVILPNM